MPWLLDRYVVSLWLRLFVLTALGFPIVSILINLTDSLNKLLDRGLSVQQIAVSYVYSVPENMFLVLPAAVLFATVFTIGTMARHSEITAVKAGGLSFRRLMVPIVVLSAFAAGLGVVVGELAPGATARQAELQKARPEGPTSARFNFVYRADEGWVYTVKSLELATRKLKSVLFERQGTGLEYPGLVVTADSATYDQKAGAWRLWNGASRVIASPVRQATFEFKSLRLRSFTQAPADLYIEALQRSGNDANKLIVERALKLAIPATCLIIAVFGAPLAITSPRSGTAFGIAISLGTTVLFLLLMQIAKAVGAGGVVHPVAAAWMPSTLFLLLGAVLLLRVRT
jgi:lipopolysaccharide export system permease protein